MRRHASLHLTFAVATLLTSSAIADASAQATGSQPATPAAQQGSQAAAIPPIDFSGVIFGNYSRRSDSTAHAQMGGKDPNQFNIERVYLTFRMPVGERASIRATADVVQNANGNYYNGWTVRLKYGYLQYNFLNNIAHVKGFNALGRIGTLHTVVIDHEEQFWPRYLSQTAMERFGFFSSADLGAATQISLPSKLGEIYSTITNGPGYTSPETDRFKDLALRLSITPFASRTSGFLQTLAISPWFYRGNTGSKFANGTAPTQVGPVTDGVRRDRWGVFVGERSPRLTLGVHYARRTEGYEYGSNTVASPRSVSDTTGTLLSGYVVARPLQWNWGSNTSKLGAVFRWDDFKSRSDLAGSQRLLIAGIQYEPTTRTAFAIDYQNLAPRDYADRAPIAETRTWFLHWSATF